MKKLISLVIFTCLICSCRREPLKWDIDGIAPLLHTKLTVQQAIPDSLLFVGDSGLLNFTFSDQLFSLDLDSVLTVPDTTISDEFSLPIAITLPPGAVFLSDTVNNQYQIANAKLTLLEIQSGQILLTIRHSIEAETVMEYSIPSATKNGQPFFIKEKIPAALNNTPFQKTYTYDMSGYDFSLTGDKNDNYNVIATAYRVYIDSNSSAVTINPGDKFNIANTLQSITPSYARGYFGKELVQESGNDTASEFFNQIGDGSIKLEEIDILLIVSNEVGIDASVLIKKLTGTNTRNNTAVSLEAPITKAPIFINRATANISKFPPVNASSLTVPLNAQNSNINEFISNLPNVLTYQLEMLINPLENISNTNDFVNLNTGLNVDVEANAPMHFSSSNLIILDTTEFEMETDSKKEIEQIQGGYILLNSTNWYPISFESQFYMLDQDLEIIDSLMPKRATIPGANLFGQERVTSANQSQLKIPVTPTQIQHLYQTKFMATRIGFTTVGAESVKIFDNYFLDVRIAGDINYMITIE